MLNAVVDKSALGSKKFSFFFLYFSTLRSLFVSILMLVLVSGCSSGSNPPVAADTVFDGVWESEGFVLGGRVATLTLTINEGSLTKVLRFSDGTSDVSESGSLWLTGTMTTASGLPAYKVNAVYDQEDYLATTGTTSPRIYDLAYLKGDTLYFGERSTLSQEECEGEYIVFDTEVVNGVVRNLDPGHCTDRPKDLNFDIPFRKLSE